MEIVYSTGVEQEHALNAVIGERAHQDAKWGTIQDRPKQVGSYLTLMRKLLRDAEDNWATSNDDNGALAELRKVVAVGVACFEQHGVPMRDVQVVAAPPARVWATQKDERLAGVDNNKLHEMYDALRDKNIGATREVVNSDGEVISLTRNAIDDELTARGDGPIPF